MHAQLTYFDGPRTPEQLTAADFADRERVIPRSKSSATPSAPTCSGERTAQGSC